MFKSKKKIESVPLEANIAEARALAHSRQSKRFFAQGNIASATPDRSKLWAVGTPQTFRTDLIVRAYNAVAEAGQTVTDDAGALEFIGEKARLVEWQKPNLKVTVAEDLAIAGELLRI